MSPYWSRKNRNFSIKFLLLAENKSSSTIVKSLDSAATLSIPYSVDVAKLTIFEFPKWQNNSLQIAVLPLPVGAVNAII